MYLNIHSNNINPLDKPQTTLLENFNDVVIPLDSKLDKKLTDECSWNETTKCLPSCLTYKNIDMDKSKPNKKYFDRLFGNVFHHLSPPFLFSISGIKKQHKKIYMVLPSYRFILLKQSHIDGFKSLSGSQVEMDKINNLHKVIKNFQKKKRPDSQIQPAIRIKI